MIEKAQNKSIDPAQNVTITAKSQIVNEYHFAGAPDYEPLSVTANTIEEATALWEKNRVSLKPAEVVVDAAEVAEVKAEPEVKPEVKTKTQQ